MGVSIVRLGTRRGPDEGLRLGTVRRPPRGVKKTDYAKLDFYDLWLPDLAPSEELLKQAKASEGMEAGWASFTRKFLQELRSPEKSRLLDLLAGLSKQTNFSLGCYCADESRCHRSLLRKELERRGALFAKASE
jgi:uncharacterized protein YeaO (DUF488 family)